MQRKTKRNENRSNRIDKNIEIVHLWSADAVVVTRRIQQQQPTLSQSVSNLIVASLSATRWVALPPLVNATRRPNVERDQPRRTEHLLGADCEILIRPQPPSKQPTNRIRTTGSYKVSLILKRTRNENALANSNFQQFFAVVLASLTIEAHRTTFLSLGASATDHLSPSLFCAASSVNCRPTWNFLRTFLCWWIFYHSIFLSADQRHDNIIGWS